MNVHPQRQLAYLAHPRTASRSTIRALEPLGFKQVGDHHSGVPPDIKTRTRYHGIRDITDGARFFTTVRNPFDIAISWVVTTHRARADMGILEYDLDDFRQALLTNSYVERGLFWHCDAADVVLRFETLERDLRDLLGEPIELERVGVSKARASHHYSDFYTPETRAFVEELFSDEIRELGYTYTEN